MSHENRGAQETPAELGQMVTGYQLDHFQLDEANVWRDRFIAWQADRMRDNACTECQIEAMASKVLNTPYAFWIHAMPRRP